MYLTLFHVQCLTDLLDHLANDYEITELSIEGVSC